MESKDDTERKHTTGKVSKLKECRKWKQPMEGSIMINTDAAISSQMIRTGMAGVAWDWNGKILKAWGWQEDRRSEPYEEETAAIRMVLIIAKETKWRRIEVQSDCKGAIDKVQAGKVEDSTIATILEDIQAIREIFEHCTFSFLYRTGTVCTYTIAQFAVKLIMNVMWKNSFPHVAQEEYTR